ncbi:MULTISPECIES: S1 family peptidase [Micromonospora]|uniref:S1 family peptidase n=1 Tax=Micromonospora TaxID=1873 RepID=UPI0005BCB917|nr:MULTISPECIES: S1 family peptidase [unclassified Micromonospora]MCK1809556.1 S1 family peptidase [Micromonospora sp. R42106]MCK1834527.1 S1 family peptidase [Micromonospora sp. R42003]MCK1846461.1 S1 family peptidase [Micromonospora sp. R42004]MCM1016542.1 S1 family peptidase [Micromonospora sp. XM-20-01]
MDRRRMTAIGVLVAAAGLTAAVTVPSFAGEEPRRAAPATDGVAPEVLDAMGRDLSLTRDQAVKRLRTERWAAGTVTRLRAELGAGYGGSWLSADGATLTVAVADAAGEARVKAAGAVPKRVARGVAELDAVKSRLDAAGGAASPDIAGWYVDVTDNTVVVVARPGAEADGRRFAAAAGPKTAMVRVRTADEAPRPLFDVRGGDAFFINNAGRCSVGFSVVGGFVTAGHCGRPGDRTTGSNRVAQGTFAASSFPGDDWAFVRVNGDWTPQGVVTDFSDGRTVAVNGSTEAPVGASICRSGSTTGTRCGLVQAKNATVNYPEGTVTGLTRTNVCAEPGDSGGAWLSGDQAQGVTSGGSGDCTRGGVTFFQPVNEILQRNNLTLVTAGGQPAPTQPPAGGGETAPPATVPPTPPAGDTECAGQVSRSGRIAAGRVQVQPDGRFFRVPGGTQEACLAAPDGVRVTLELQRFTNGAFRTVARATSADGVARLTVEGPAGAYRYRVTGLSGSGEYTLAFSAR